MKQGNLLAFVIKIKPNTDTEDDKLDKKLEYNYLCELPGTNSNMNPTELNEGKYLRAVDDEIYLDNENKGFWMLYFPQSKIDAAWVKAKQAYFDGIFMSVSTIAVVYGSYKKDSCIQFSTGSREATMKGSISEILTIFDDYDKQYVYYKTKALAFRHADNRKRKVDEERYLVDGTPNEKRSSYRAAVDKVRKGRFNVEEIGPKY